MGEKKAKIEKTAVKAPPLGRAVGRRKTAAARVWLTPGTGSVAVNGRPLAQYFSVRLWQREVTAPLTAAGREKNLDVSVKVVGGGLHGQAIAARHGIARALVALDAGLRPLLRAEGYLTRDPRAKGRKKFGKHRARRGHQWRKR